MAKTAPSREFKVDGAHVSPPAYFLSLSVENIRCFGPKQTLDLSDGKGNYAPWTIILGDNGFGKTTLLQCLCILLHDGYSHSLTRGLVRDNENVIVIPRINSKFHSSIECNIAINQGDSEEFNFIDGIINFVFREDGASVKSTQRKHGEDLDKLICYAYGASRKLAKGTALLAKADSTTDSLFNEDVALINAEEWFLQADYLSHLSSSKKAVYHREQVKEALTQLLPSVDDIRIRFSTETKPNVRMEVKTPFGWVHVQSLSLGYRTLIAWVVDLANRLFERYPDSPNPLAEPAVVLVDEIDLHLHPKFQRTLMDYLTNLFPKAQFIATAHSPLVVQAASNANIALLRREGDHVVIDNDVEAIANWRVDQILTSDLFGLESARPPQLDSLLQERTRLLSKARLSKKDKERLAQLEAQIGDLPVGETPDDMKAMDIIRRAAQVLEEQGVR